MFMALDNYFNAYKGYLKVKNILDEFIKRNMIEEEDYKIFTFIDCYNMNKGSLRLFAIGCSDGRFHH